MSEHDILFGAMVDGTEIRLGAHEKWSMQYGGSTSESRRQPSTSEEGSDCWNTKSFRVLNELSDIYFD